jgi:basic membrane protein A
MKLITPAVAELISQAQAGTFKGGNVFGAAGLAPFHDFDNSVPKPLKDLLTATKAGLDSGIIRTGYGN